MTTKLPLLLSISLLSLSGGLILSALLSAAKGSLLLEWTLLNCMSTKIQFFFFFDWISLLFFAIVCFISSCVFKFSSDYMPLQESTQRFHWILLLFVSSMGVLVFSLNLISLLLGWDGLGIISFLLVIFYQSPKANSSGMITALSNRIGDVLLLLSISFFVEMGGWGFMPMTFSEIPTMIGFMLLLAASTKSAQLPFSAWLPAAMAAPTPVSTLVHSSTLVTAGIYLLMRFYPSIPSEVWPPLLLIAMITSVMASVSATLETDLKKVVALSTLSQLGVMMMAMALGYPFLSFFHLLTHASFKALMFLSAGKIIHESGGSQDLRLSGGLMKVLPVTVNSFSLSSAALCGLPFMSGFYSKDAILETLFSSHISSLLLLLVIPMILLSSSYSLRLMLSCFMSAKVWPPLHKSGEGGKMNELSNFKMVFFALTSGALLSWYLSPEMVTPLSWFMKQFTVSLTILGGGVAIYITLKKNSKKTFLPFSALMMLTPLFSGVIPVLGSLQTRKILLLDLGWLEALSGGGLVQHLSSIRQKSGWGPNSIKVNISLLILLFILFV